MTELGCCSTKLSTGMSEGEWLGIPCWITVWLCCFTILFTGIYILNIRNTRNNMLNNYVFHQAVHLLCCLIVSNMTLCGLLLDISIRNNARKIRMTCSRTCRSCFVYMLLCVPWVGRFSHSEQKQINLIRGNHACEHAQLYVEAGQRQMKSQEYKVSCCVFSTPCECTSSCTTSDTSSNTGLTAWGNLPWRISSVTFCKATLNSWQRCRN